MKLLVHVWLRYIVVDQEEEQDVERLQVDYELDD